MNYNHSWMSKHNLPLLTSTEGLRYSRQKWERIPFSPARQKELLCKWSTTSSAESVKHLWTRQKTTWDGGQNYIIHLELAFNFISLFLYFSPGDWWWWESLWRLQFKGGVQWDFFSTSSSGSGLVPFSRRKQERDFIQLNRGTRLECGLQLLLILLESWSSSSPSLSGAAAHFLSSASEVYLR